LKIVLAGGIPDRVPVAPDFSNMIPARMTGKPFWDLYLYSQPPIWEAFITAAKYFGIDALMDGYCPLVFPEERAHKIGITTYIVYRDESKIITQYAKDVDGELVWLDQCDVYGIDNPPTWGVPTSKVDLPREPNSYEEIDAPGDEMLGPDNLKHIKEMMGDQGLVGTTLVGSLFFEGNEEEGIYLYHDNPDKHERWAHERVEKMEARFANIMAMDVKPDFLCVGASGTMVFQSEEMFRTLAFPAVKRGIELAHAAGIPTHVHSCGPETLLVKIMAEETDLTVIDPLEIPPMGDCNLAELKRLYGDKIVLKGNLHTTNVMLRGTPDDVKCAAIQAMRDAGKGGRFILSTGDQCGRDTPDENIFALIDAVEKYGIYDQETGELPYLPKED
jgi:uroporphyrinogen decarboxylase